MTRSFAIMELGQCKSGSKLCSNCASQKDEYSMGYHFWQSFITVSAEGRSSCLNCNRKRVHCKNFSSFQEQAAKERGGCRSYSNYTLMIVIKKMHQKQGPQMFERCFKVLFMLKHHSAVIIVFYLAGSFSNKYILF